jgi:hypothetical protein
MKLIFLHSRYICGRFGEFCVTIPNENVNRN